MRQALLRRPLLWTVSWSDCSSLPAGVHIQEQGKEQAASRQICWKIEAGLWESGEGDRKGSCHDQAGPVAQAAALDCLMV
jgi:hypothetical protein